MSKSILVNASNVRSPGAVSLAISLLRAFDQSDRDFKYVVLVSPESKLKESIEQLTRVEYFEIGRIPKINSLNRIWTEYRSVPSYSSRTKPDALLVLGNLAPAWTGIPTTVLLQHPLIAETSLPAAPPAMGRISLAINRFLFRRTAKHASAIIVQTQHMLRAITANYEIPSGKVHIVPNNVSKDLLTDAPGDIVKRHLGPKLQSVPRLIYPAAPYPYKNFELILKLCHDMKGANPRRARFVLTLDESSNPGKSLMKRVRSEGLEAVVENVGILNQKELSREYAKSSALFFPSLAESFGNPLLEAAAFGLPVMAADLDYAHDVMGDAAIYFDPHNLESANAAIAQIRDATMWQDYSARSLKRFAATPSWLEIGNRFLEIVNATLES